MSGVTYVSPARNRYSQSSTIETADMRNGTGVSLNRNRSLTASVVDGNHWGTMILAIMASIGVMLLRMQGSMMVGWLWTEFALVIGFGIAFRLRSMANQSAQEPPAVSTYQRWVMLCTVIFLLAPWLSSFIQRRALGATGEAVELIWLAMLQYAAIWQAATARLPRHDWTSFLLSSFLVLFSVATSDRSGMWLVVTPYGLGAAWWLMSRYWRSIEHGFVAIESVPLIRLRLGMLSIAITIAIFIAWFTVPGANSIVMLDGFMPTSGGRKDADPSSRQGVGDGDMLVAARDEAYTFGPVDSELFLDSQAPSMYDLISESFGEPTKRKVQYSRAIALENEVQEAKEEGTESKQKGKEFSAMRQPRDRATPVKPKGSTSDALLYVLGESPLHLRMESYDAFDGVVWKQTESAFPKSNTTSQPSPTLLEIGGKPWMLIGKYLNDLAYSVRERLSIKIINFQSQRVPSPALLTHVHVDKVNQEDFFGWMGDGQLMMPNREYIPQLTVLHAMYQVPQLHLLRDRTSDRSRLTISERNESGSNTRPELENADWIKLYLQLPGQQNSLSATAMELIRATAGKATESLTDWQRIEAFVSTMRRDFKMDNQHVPPKDCEDVVKHLLETKCGPDYVMSTAASMMIRSLGIPCRLATGFYVQPSRYDIKSGQTEVLRNDVHTWCEVYVHGAWLPIEVCGEYAIPREYRSWRQWALETLSTWRADIQNHAYWYLINFSVVVAAFCLRRRLLDAFVSTGFVFLRPLAPHLQVRACLQLLRLRRWCWNQKASEGETVQGWLSEQLSADCELDSAQRQVFIAAVQRMAYAPRSTAHRWLATHSHEIQKIRWLIARKGITDLFLAGRRKARRAEESLAT